MTQNVANPDIIMTDEGILGRTETGRNIRSLCVFQPLHRSGSNHVFTIHFHWILYPVRDEIGRSCPDLREKQPGPTGTGS